jgi:predicted ArsR family transcriptional regulator
MRPPGEIRLAIREAAIDLAVDYSAPTVGPTARELAGASQVGLQAARRTLDNMVRSGELEVVGTVPLGRGRPAAMYRPVPELNAGASLTPLQRSRIANE